MNTNSIKTIKQARSGFLIICAVALSFLGACSTQVASTVRLTQVCTLSPSSIVNWWNGSSLAGSILYDLVGSNNGTAKNISLTPAHSTSALSINSWGSSTILLDASQSNFQSGFTVGGWFQSSPTVLSSATRMILAKGLRSPTVSSSQFKTFDASTLDTTITGFGGSAFDGRYIYFGPGTSGIATRYDTALPFSTKSSWSYFNLSALNPSASSFSSAIFDGRYIYFVPNKGGTSGLVAAYDTTKSFSSSASWNFFDLAANIDSNLTGYGSAAFDGKSIYFCPGGSNTSNNGRVVQYDTTKTLSSPSAWSFSDVNALQAGANHFSGAVFDGRYLYCIPIGISGDFQGIVAQFDTTQGSVNNSSGWSFVDLSTSPFNTGNSNPVTGYGSAVFDGRYIYFVPFVNNSGSSSVLARFDTTQSLTTNAAWTYLDISTVAGGTAGTRGYCSSAFDGQYLYLYGCGSTLTRYDTAASFTDSTSWRFSFSTPAAVGQLNLFDGHYLYFGSNKTIGQYNTNYVQSPFELTASTVTSDGHSMSTLGPTFQITTDSGTYLVRSSALSDSNWHFIVGSYDTSAIRIYIDGVLVNSQTVQGTLVSNTQYYSLGTYGANSLSFGGLLDDIQIYNTALSEADIQNLYIHTYDSAGLCQ